jgi:hypothetical protein
MKELIDNVVKHHRYPLVWTGKTRLLSPTLDSLTVNGETTTVYRTDTEAQFLETYHGKRSIVWYAISFEYVPA